MHFDFVHGDWICASHKAHEYENDIINSKNIFNCGCTDEKYVIEWNYRDDPDKPYEPLSKNKTVMINIKTKEWKCPEGHSHQIDTPIFRSYDTLICSECQEQYQFAPTIKIPAGLLSKLKERMDAFES